MGLFLTLIFIILVLLSLIGWGYSFITNENRWIKILKYYGDIKIADTIQMHHNKYLCLDKNENRFLVQCRVWERKEDYGNYSREYAIIDYYEYAKSIDHLLPHYEEKIRNEKMAKRSEDKKRHEILKNNYMEDVKKFKKDNIKFIED